MLFVNVIVLLLSECSAYHFDDSDTFSAYWTPGSVMCVCNLFAYMYACSMLMYNYVHRDHYYDN